MDTHETEAPGALREEIRRKYNAFARWYDAVESIPEICGLSRLRHELLRRASGHVLEVAVGTGKNLRHYPKGCRITGVDVAPAMLAIAQKRARRLKLPLTLIEMDAAMLGFADHSFDTVVDTLAFCTFPDPVAVLREMARVCRRDGRLLLLEHGRSDRARLGQWQDRHADRHARRLCCRWNREPLDIVRRAGLELNAVQRTFFGIFQMLEVSPVAASPSAHGLGATP